MLTRNRTQGSETQASVQKLPTDGYTDTASIMAFGYNPYVASWSPYHGAAYAVVEAAAKVVAVLSVRRFFCMMNAPSAAPNRPLVPEIISKLSSASIFRV